MIPLSLRLRNFMSYGEHVPPLDFTPITTACLTGDNGHGKSALLDAITWALWGQTRAKNLDDIVRLGQEECEVEFVFDLEGDRYRVLRKRSLRTRSGLSALELHGFDPAAQSYRALSGNSIRETEAKIAQILHMNYDTFVNSVFILQGRADEFTTRRPGERKRILSEILGLSVFDELQTRARIHHGSLDQEAKTIAEHLHELQQQVARKADLAAAVDTHRKTLTSLQAELHEAQKNLTHLQQRQNALELQQQRLQDVSRRLQQLRQEQGDLAPQLALHRQHLADYETLLKQEQAITTAYQALQQLRDQERVYSQQADEYAALNQKRTTLQHVVASARQRLDIQLQNAEQRGTEIDAKRRDCEVIVLEEPCIVQAYEALQAARRRDGEIAQTLQQRYVREQEKGQIELSIQQKRHALELEQRSLLDRQKEYQRKEATLPTWQEQTEQLRQQLGNIEQQALQLEGVRAAGATLTFQLDHALPQKHDALRTEIRDYEGKRLLLESAEAHCPLCENALTDQKRHRVMRKLKLEIEQREQRIRDMQDERNQLQERQQELHLTYKQLEEQIKQGRTLTQQLAAAQAGLEEATRARDHCAAVLQALQEIDAQLAAGAYAREDLAHLERLNVELEQLAYDPEAYEALREKLARLAEAETRHLQLQQAKADLLTLNTQRQEITQQQAVLRETLTSNRFALSEQQELQEIAERLQRLDYQPEQHNLLRRKLQGQQGVERQFAQLETARQHLSETHAALQDLEARRARTDIEIGAREEDRQRFEHEVQSLDAVRADADTVEDLVRALREREGETRLALGRSQSQYEVCLQQEAELQAQQQQRQRVVSERQLYDDLTRMFGKNGIQAIMIENAIPELEEEANRILSRVSDNAMHVTLETQRDTRTGGVAETLDIKISDDLGTRNYELFSGGEAFRINFALRIALSRMLARRAGARLRTLVIDEGFGTQDTQGLERLVEVIKAIQDDFAKIIIITHLRELKNAFETHIEVTKDPVLGSSFEVV